jgi:hypothetical protein
MLPPVKLAVTPGSIANIFEKPATKIDGRRHTPFRSKNFSSSGACITPTIIINHLSISSSLFQS